MAERIATLKRQQKRAKAVQTGNEGAVRAGASNIHTPPGMPSSKESKVKTTSLVVTRSRSVKTFKMKLLFPSYNM